MKKILLLLFSCVLYLLTWSQETPDEFSVKDSLLVKSDIFDEEEPALITLKYDIRQYQRKKFADEYMDAELVYHLGDSIDDVVRNVRIKARGKNRRSVCSFPPLWINIGKADIVNENLQETKKIKLVTHCSGLSYEVYVLKEYLAYRMYNILSPYSFRVRLVDVRYIDTGRKNKETISWGILIEPEAMMAERLDALPLKMDQLGLQHTDSAWTETMTIFQFMIGNGDYSVQGRHNIKLIKSKDPLSIYPIPVPYDFDYCGLVNAHYAVPGETLGIESVTDRYFLGPCRSTDEYRRVIRDFMEKKEEIYRLVNTFEYLSERERKQMILYLDQFFTSANEDWYIESKILSTCR